MGFRKRLDTTIRVLGERGLRRRPISDYEERLEREIDCIKQMKFAGYFLIVWDFIKYAREVNIPVGPGRGSAAGSLVSYAMEITDIDPLQNALLFERFLNPERVSMPDIDIDFCMNRRGEVIDYVTRKYGREQVAQIITFNTMAARAAIKDVGRALDLPYGEVDRVAKMVPATIGVTIAKALQDSPQMQEAYDKEPQVRELVDTARKLEGLVRGAGLHAAGVVIAPQPLTELVPVCRSKNDEIVTAYDMKAVEKLGLLKMDFLGLTTLTVIDDALKLIERKRGSALDMSLIPLDDTETYEKVFHRALTSGVFQFESGGMRDVLRRYKPVSVEDLTALNALYRPGPIQGGMIDDFIERKWGRRVVSYELPELEALLKETLGVIVYQEQVMQIANVLAGYSLGEADLLRRAMGKKNPEEMAKQRNRFVEGAIQRKHPKDKVVRIFDLMEQFAGYGFNKSHSAAYALLAYHTAYLKTHYPVEFMAALLTSEISKPENVVKYIKECREMGIAVEPPDVQISGAGLHPQCDRHPLRTHGHQERGPQRHRFDHRRAGAEWRLPYVLGVLRKSRSAPDEQARSGIAHQGRSARLALGAAPSSLPSPTGRWSGRSRRSAIWLPASMASSPAWRAFSKAGSNGHKSNDDLPNTPDWDENERLQAEKEVLGFFVSGHPLDKYAEKLRNLNVVDTATALEMKAPPPARRRGRRRRTRKPARHRRRHCRPQSRQVEALRGDVRPGFARRHGGQDRHHLFPQRLCAAL